MYAFNLNTPQALVVVGGWNEFGASSSVLTLTPGAEAWTPLASLPRPLTLAKASIVGSMLRVTAGYDMSRFRTEVGTISIKIQIKNFYVCMWVGTQTMNCSIHKLSQFS